MAEIKLFSVIMCRRGLTQEFRLNYDNAEAANEAFVALRSFPDATTLTLADSFGTKIAIRHDEVGSVVLQDLSQIMNFKVMESILTARAQADANRQQQTDPRLMLGRMIPQVA